MNCFFVLLYELFTEQPFTKKNHEPPPKEDSTLPGKKSGNVSNLSINLEASISAVPDPLRPFCFLLELLVKHSITTRLCIQLLNLKLVRIHY